MASPKQRIVVLKVVDSEKRTSEGIRQRAYQFNANLTRISTKAILKELISNSLIESEMGDDRKRYYWIGERGKRIVNDMV